MGGTTTRARTKAKVVEEPVVDIADDARATQIELLNMKVEQHSVNLAVEVQKREALEAELRQSLTETRFELRQLQQSRAKAIEAIKDVKEKYQKLHTQYVGRDAAVASLRKDVDRLLDGALAPRRMNAPQSPQSSLYDEEENLKDKRRIGASRAESMVSDLDDARSEVSSIATGYVHSSLESALASVRGRGKCY